MKKDNILILGSILATGLMGYALYMYFKKKNTSNIDIEDLLMLAQKEGKNIDFINAARVLLASEKLKLTPKMKETIDLGESKARELREGMSSRGSIYFVSEDFKNWLQSYKTSLDKLDGNDTSKPYTKATQRGSNGMLEGVKKNEIKNINLVQNPMAKAGLSLFNFFYGDAVVNLTKTFNDAILGSLSPFEMRIAIAMNKGYTGKDNITDYIKNELNNKK